MKEVSKYNKVILLLIWGFILTTQERYQGDIVIADDVMNIYSDGNIAFQYPPDFLFQGKQIFHLKKGNTRIQIQVLDKERFESYQDVYLHPSPDRVISPTQRPIHIGNNVWVEQYHGYEFNGIAIKSYDSEDTMGLIMVELLINRNGHYLSIEVSDKWPFSMGLLDNILRSINFPGEASYHMIAELAPRNDIIETPNSILLPRLLEVGRLSKEKRKFRVHVRNTHFF